MNWRHQETLLFRAWQTAPATPPFFNSARTLHRRLRIASYFWLLVGLFTLSLSCDCVHATQLAKLVPEDAMYNGWFGISVALNGQEAIVGTNPLLSPGNRFGPGSAYVFRDDGTGQWQQFTKLVPSDSKQGDRFGDSVALSGNLAIIGAPTGHGGAVRSGSAYIFEKTAMGIWNEAAILTSPTPFDFNSFGKSVAIDGDTVVIGTGGDTAPLNEVGGRAYVYRRDDSGNWNEIATLKASDAEMADGFGYPSVSISGNKIIVGAYLDDNVAHEAGSAYIFEEDGNGHWNQAAKLIAHDADTGNRFGWAVDISGDTAVIGSQTGGDSSDFSGAAYIFQDDGSGTWTEQTKLLGMPGTNFGHQVAISEGLVVAGSLTDDFGQFTGSAFAFRQDPFGNWQEVAKLTANDASAGDHFGNGLSISGDNVMIGAWTDNHSGHDNAGSAYLFRVPPIPEPTTYALVMMGWIATSICRLRPRQ